MQRSQAVGLAPPDCGMTLAPAHDIQATQKAQVARRAELPPPAHTRSRGAAAAADDAIADAAPAVARKKQKREGLNGASSAEPKSSKRPAAAAPTAAPAACIRPVLPSSAAPPPSTPATKTEVITLAAAIARALHPSATVPQPGALAAAIARALLPSSAAPQPSEAAARAKAKALAAAITRALLPSPTAAQPSSAIAKAPALAPAARALPPSLAAPQPSEPKDTAAALATRSQLELSLIAHQPAEPPAAKATKAPPAPRMRPVLPPGWNTRAHRLPDFQNCNAGKPPSKFAPLPSLRPAVSKLVVKDTTTLEPGASILIIQNPWLSLLLDGVKTLEIRGGRCAKPQGERFYLALSGSGGMIFGSVEFVACHGPLTTEAYTARSAEHCMGGATLPYGTTYAWEVTNPICFKGPVPYTSRAASSGPRPE